MKDIFCKKCKKGIMGEEVRIAPSGTTFWDLCNVCGHDSRIKQPDEWGYKAA